MRCQKGSPSPGEEVLYIITMAEAWDDDQIFVYTGGDQAVPMDIRRVRIDKSVNIIPERAFEFRRSLIYIEFHEGIETIGKWAFHCCRSLRSVKLMGVEIIGYGAFTHCVELTDLEFGYKLETIRQYAFSHCCSLRSIVMPSVTIIEMYAFNDCVQMTDLDLSERLETIGQRAFHNCNRLRRITLPLRDNIIEGYVFYNCAKLTTVDLVGGIHKTVASLHLESWRNEMNGEINRINQALPNARRREISVTFLTQQWMRSVIRRLDHYKVEHKAMLKEATTLLELALWKADLNVKEEGIEREGVRTTRGRRKRARKEICITSGASIVIKNVLPFLQIR